jgi:hypothetical protein
LIDPPVRPTLVQRLIKSFSIKPVAIRSVRSISVKLISPGWRCGQRKRDARLKRSPKGRRREASRKPKRPPPWQEIGPHGYR